MMKRNNLLMKTHGNESEIDVFMVLHAWDWGKEFFTKTRNLEPKNNK